MAVVKGVQRAKKWSRLDGKRSLSTAKWSLAGLRYQALILWRKNPLLSWTCLITLCVLLGANVALLTPIWSDRASTDGKQLSDFLNKDSKVDGAIANSLQLSRPVHILVMGSLGNYAATSDTMLLLRLNPDNQSIKVLSIPRDSMVVIPEVGLEKISLANTNGGPALATRVVSKSLNNVPIDRYVRITNDGLRELVNVLDGIEIFVPQEMAYQDSTQKLEIDLQAGWQTLDGDRAAQFARFQDKESGDLGRVQRQQLLIESVRDRLTNPAIIAHLPQLVGIMQKYVDTNLSPEEMLVLANFGAAIDPQNLQMVILPGNLSALSRDPSSYWLDPGGQDRVMSNYFGVNPAVGTPKVRSLASLTIAVQNASGEPNLSDRVVRKLKQQGLEKVSVISDWQDVQRQTEIIVQRGDFQAAADLQKVLGLGKMEYASTGDLNSQLTIRVGKDWSEQTPLSSN
ncbi:transcriptional regulator [Aliterella atlantica CENA595]|uniref:Transcriptional regulator n=1 Tax=Aliterella atlantica CENA595 TaxID=1618023 RepID=A0A0D8ZY66_9CYAN|nr:transcriptional regulator [Aliterella atlantica CENA595]